MSKNKRKKGYDFSEREKFWQDFWQKEGVYEFNPESKKPVYSIDTPPPTVSGDLHLGHVFSYGQAEVIARFKRMKGFNVRYPLGLDNNGLPTERLVEKEIGKKGKDMDTDKFIDECLSITEKYNKKYRDLWKIVGMSFDWKLEYSTISKKVQKISQSVFKELYEKGFIYRKKAPALFCTECSTSFAQAEKEDEEKEAFFFDLIFKRKNGEDLIISTTRPELLPACVAVFVHPEDDRYKDLEGESVKTPLGEEVPVFFDEQVEIEKGSGAVMCCTYGDETDVYWKKVYDLEEKIILNYEGEFEKIDEVPEMNGKKVIEGRDVIIKKLSQEGFLKDKEKISHSVGVHERCGQSVEFLPTEQWFLKILDMKDELLRYGEELNWYPSHMKSRYDEWVENLKWDWCISRERFYGIPIPVFKCNNCEYVEVPSEEDLPIDPREKDLSENCPKCEKGKIVPEKNILDTWFTSALTPDINNIQEVNGKLKEEMYPMSMRPQAHEIIRTWTVYTMLMSIYRREEIPWKDVMISGHLLLKRGEKISKSKGGGKYKPRKLIEEDSADAVRYTMYGVKLGKDGFFAKEEVENGKRLVNKIYNAGRLVLGRLSEFNFKDDFPKKKLESFDRWILDKSLKTARKMEEAFDDYDFSKAKKIFEDFFWTDFCDNYIEIVKDRLYLDPKNEEEKQKKESAHYTIYKSFLNNLKMLSPFMPHITEEIYHSEVVERGGVVSNPNKGLFYKREEERSIHIASWPNEKDDYIDRDMLKGAERSLKIITEVRKSKTKENISLGSEITLIKIYCNENQKNNLDPFISDIVSVTGAKAIKYKESNDFKIELEI